MNENEIVYAVEEDDEEETFRLDFDTNQAHSVSNTVVAFNPENTTLKSDKKVWVEKDNSVKEKDEYKNRLQDLLLNSITSKAIASLIAKNKELEDELDSLMLSKKFGALYTNASEHIEKATDNTRNELKKCLVAGQVRYEDIPNWSKEYIEEYIKNMVLGLSILIEDEN